MIDAVTVHRTLSQVTLRVVVQDVVLPDGAG